jgi:hypothetical protein
LFGVLGALDRRTLPHLQVPGERAIDEIFVDVANAIDATLFIPTGETVA